MVKRKREGMATECQLSLNSYPSVLLFHPTPNYIFSCLTSSNRCWKCWCTRLARGLKGCSNRGPLGQPACGLDPAILPLNPPSRDQEEKHSSLEGSALNIDTLW